MIIMASSIAQAINECRHIRPEELIKEQIVSSVPEQAFEIELINSYGHIVYSFVYKCKTEKQAITKAKKERFFYPETAWIEIINTETRKRIYA